MSRVPVTIVSGFLGSGKTTLLNHLLRGDHGLRVMVLVNEFGDVDIDGALLPAGQRFVTLTNGCLCCVLNAELTQTLVDLALERQRFDLLVIETTGLADPLSVAWTFSKPGLAEAFRVDCIVTVVDAEQLSAQVQEHRECALQLGRADLVVLNKLDLASDGGARAREVIASRNPQAPVIDATRGQVPWSVLMGVGARASQHRMEPDPRRDPALSPVVPAHVSPHTLRGLLGSALSRSCLWLHAMLVSQTAPHAHDAHFATYTFRTAATFDEAALDEMLDSLPASVVRAKGIVSTNAEWGWSLVNVVGHRVDIVPYDGERPEGESHLVFIGPDLDGDALGQLCASCLALPG